MIIFLKTYLKTRTFWLTLSLIACLLESTSLYLQHIMLFEPCVLCIYQRCALFGIIISGLFITIAPTYRTFQYIGLSSLSFNAWQGLLLAKKQNDMQLHPSPFVTCDLFVKFPTWLPLDQWIPSIFYAYGDCTDHKYHILSLEISQWMIIIFSFYLITTITIIIIPIILNIKKFFQKNNIKKF